MQWDGCKKMRPIQPEGPSFFISHIHEIHLNKHLKELNIFLWPQNMYKQIRFQKIEFVSHDFKQVYIAACTVSRAQFLKISLDSQHTYNLVNRSLSIFSSRSCRQRQKIKNRSRYIWTISNKGLPLSVLQAAPRFAIKIRSLAFIYGNTVCRFR